MTRKFADAVRGRYCLQRAKGGGDDFVVIGLAYLAARLQLEFAHPEIPTAKKSCLRFGRTSPAA